MHGQVVSNIVRHYTHRHANRGGLDALMFIATASRNQKLGGQTISLPAVFYSSAVTPLESFRALRSRD